MPSSSSLNDLPFILARAGLIFRRFSDKTLREAGLKGLAPGLATVLHALEEIGQCSVNELVEATHLPNGTLTGLLDSLARDKLVERIRNPDDGRSWLVRLTDGGKKRCKALAIRHRLVMETLGRVLSVNELAQLAKLLEKTSTCMRDCATESRPVTRKRTSYKSASKTKPTNG